jgi:hypothetical protein
MEFRQDDVLVDNDSVKEISVPKNRRTARMKEICMFSPTFPVAGIIISNNIQESPQFFIFNSRILMTALVLHQGIHHSLLVRLSQSNLFK